MLGDVVSASYGPKVGTAYLLDIKLVNWFVWITWLDTEAVIDELMANQTGYKLPEAGPGVKGNL